MEEKLLTEEEKKAVIPPAEEPVIESEEKTEIDGGADKGIELNSNPVPVEEDENESPIPEAEAEPEIEIDVDLEPEGNSELQESGIPGVQEKPALFTQKDMDDLAGRTRVETRERTFKYVYDRYGVENEEQMDELFGNAQRYETLKEQYDSERAERDLAEKSRNDELMGLKEQVALMQSGIDKSRYEDAKLILRGKGLEVSLENIESELATHPEWKKEEIKSEPAPFVKKEENPEPVSKISVLGNSKDAKPVSPELDEKAQARKLFDL